jgi:hypothetical protein
MMTEQETRNRFATMTEHALGNFGEAVWARILAASGLGYIPLCNIETGRAPVIEGRNPIVLPDFEVVDAAFNVYLESKAKTTSVLWRRQNQERHGIDRKSWVAYVKAAAVSGKPCGLGIIELFREQQAHQQTWSGSVLIETLRNLGPPIVGEPEYDQRHMVYWPRKLFCDLDSWDASELLAIAKGDLLAKYPVQLSGVFKYIPSVQQELF